MGTVRKSSWRQFLPYLALNVVVSAVTMLIVLAIWQGVSSGRVADSTPTPDVLARVASLLPTATATLPPSPTPVTYTVKDGDTLSSIARAHGITLDELMSANGLRDPNKIAVGQVLVIPIIGGSEGEPAATPPSGPQLPTATEPSGGESQGVVIHGIEGIGDLERERVRILNEGGEINLAGWMMDDGEGSIYVFPSLRFRTVGMIVVHTKEGEDTVIDLYWGLDDSIWAPGKVITLRDDSGEVQSTFQIPDS